MFERRPALKSPIVSRREMLLAGAGGLIMASSPLGRTALADDEAQATVVCRLVPWGEKAAEYPVRATLVRRGVEGTAGRMHFTSIDPQAPKMRVPWTYAAPGNYSIGELLITDPVQQHVAKMNYSQTVRQPSLRRFDFTVDVPAGTPCYIGDLVYETLAPDPNGIVGALITEVHSELEVMQDAFATLFPQSPPLVEKLMTSEG